MLRTTSLSNLQSKSSVKKAITYCIEIKLQHSTHLVVKKYVLLKQIWNRWKVITSAVVCNSLASRIKATSKYFTTLSIPILYILMRRRWQGRASAPTLWSKKCLERSKSPLLNFNQEKTLKFEYVLSCHRMKWSIVMMVMTNQQASNLFLCPLQMIYVILIQLWITRDFNRKKKNKKVLLSLYLNRKKIRLSFWWKIWTLILIAVILKIQQFKNSSVDSKL